MSTSPTAPAEGRPSSSKAGSSGSLQRGKACLNCRRRKMKCDGVRPTCGPCSHAGRSEDCEYADAQGRSRTQTLLDTIKRLETRIQELENPESTAPNVLLFDPLTQASPGHSPTGPASPAESSRGGPPTTIWDAEDLPADVGSELIDVFFQHVGHVPWFLHEARFRTSAALPPGSFDRPVPALLTAVHLWGIKFSDDDDLALHAPGILAQALSQIGHALAGAPSHSVVQVIQAHVLLSTYLYHTGRFVEGSVHTDAAAALAVHCHLHKLRSAQPTPPRATYMDPITVVLPEPRDQVEEGERINAFWVSFAQDRVWAVVLGVPTAIFDVDGVTQIDTPWPLDMDVYERGWLYPELRTSGTLKAFLNGLATGWPWENDSSLTELAKGSALLERATRLAASWRPELPDATGFYADFLALDTRIEEFKTGLCPIATLSTLPTAARQRLHATHCIAQCASIQLHAAFASQNSTSRTKCLEAGLAIIRTAAAARVSEFSFLDHGVAAIWAAVCRVLISEIITVRSLYVDPSALPLPGREAELFAALDELQATMAHFAPTSALMNYQLGRIQQERIAV
ncbi:hypothetical protein PENSPDRAFT_654321 [Peniophora sp. CONT]|nr:hypothetical protein PENSPDRAFT_654321 [Peniophora sp. CONT]